MVRRIRLTISGLFWLAAAKVHDRLHEIMDRHNLEAWSDSNVTYESPAVHYMGQHRPPDTH